MEQQPKIPTLKDAQKPQVKIKGMGAGLTLFDRLKQFKKKDLAFILAGLGTLFMAPLAEHFMMAPEGGASDMSSGFRGPGAGGSGGGGLFGGGSSPYENGNNSIAQGGAIGGGGDIITPLNVRDPSALVMGPGAAQQPNAGAATPPTPPPTAPARSETDYKDALAGAASRAASAAVKRAPLPMPKVGLSGSQLRGLGAAGGGSSSGSGGLGPIGGGAGGTAGTGGGGLNLVRSGPNFRGAAGARGSNNPSGLDGTKKAGANAGDQFSRSGSALAGLNAAASEAIPTGGSGFNGGGQGGAGANDKAGSGTGPGGSKSVGESLAFLEAKQRQEENLKLEFEKKKLKDNELLMYGIRNDIVKASATKIAELATTKLACKFLSLGCPGSDDPYTCTNGMTQTESQLKAASCSGAGKPGEAAGITAGCFEKTPTGYSRKASEGSPAVTCTATGKAADKTTNPETDVAPRTAPAGASLSQVAAITGLKDTCAKIKEKHGGAKVDIDTYFSDTVTPIAINADSARIALEGGAPDCGGTAPADAGGANAADLIKQAQAKLSKAKDPKDSKSEATGTLQQMAALVPGDNDEKVKELGAVFDSVVKTELTNAKKIIGIAEGLAKKEFALPTPKENNNATVQGSAMKLATNVKTAREAVLAEAASLRESVKSLETIIEKAKTEISDENGKGSLTDTIALNKGTKKFDAEPPAVSGVKDIVNNSGIRPEQDKALKAIQDTDKTLPLPEKSAKDYAEKEKAFKEKKAEVATAIENLQTKQADLINGTATLVDSIAVNTLKKVEAPK